MRAIDRLFCVSLLGYSLVVAGCATCERHADGCRVVGAVALVTAAFVIERHVHVSGGAPVVVNSEPKPTPCNSVECTR